MENDTRPKLKDGLAVRDLGPDRVIYDGVRDEVHVLNRTGRLVMELVDGEHTIEAITEALRARCIEGSGEAGEHDVKGDVERFMASLLEKGLLQG